MPLELLSRISSQIGRYRNGAEEWRRDRVASLSPAETERLGRLLFANLKRGGFCTHLVTGYRAWDPRGALFEAARAAARRGCEIERAFLLPGRYLRDDPSLTEHVGLDAEAGIRTLVLTVGDLIGELAASSPGSLEFGLWDGETCCMALYGIGTASATGWRVSARTEDIRRARGLTDILRQKAETVALGRGGGPSPARLEEPLVVSAAIARRMARRLCRQDPVSGEDCSSYHGTWQYLRLFNMVGTPAQHAEFFLDALGTLARDVGFRRVLVSGTADCSMAAHVLWAYRTNDANVDVTVLDRCETPLHLSTWYAESVGARIETAACPILDYEGAKPFDVICTHMFLRRFARERRPFLIAQWRRLLRPGGKLVIVTRIEPGRADDGAGLRPDRGTALHEKALSEARKWRDFLDVDPEEIARQARLFAERPPSHPVGSRKHVVDLLEGGGFTLDRVDSVQEPSRGHQRAREANAPRTVEFASIVATRN